MKKPLDSATLLKKHYQIETNRLKSAWCFGDVELKAQYPTLAQLVQDREAQLQAKLLELVKPQVIEQVPSKPEPQLKVQDVLADQAQDWLRDHGVKIPKVKAELKPFQWKVVQQLWNETIILKKQGIALHSGVGTGKTFMLGMYFALLYENNYFEGKTFAPWPVLWVTKASVVPQTIRVCENQFGLKQMDKILVTNYDQLRSSFGEQLLETYYVIKQDKEILKFKWKRYLHPLVVLWDEAHNLKNEGSQQSKVAQAFNELTDPNLIQVSMSATMWTRIADMKPFAVSTHADINELLSRV